MSEQLHHEDLTGLPNRRLAGHLHSILGDIVSQAHPVPAVTALGALFAQVCAVADVDPAATLDQVREALERMELVLSHDAQFVPHDRHVRN